MLQSILQWAYNAHCSSDSKVGEASSGSCYQEELYRQVAQGKNQRLSQFLCTLMALPLPARGTLIFALCHSRSLCTEKVRRDDQRTSCRESHTEVATNVCPLVHVYHSYQLIQSAAFFPFFLAALLIGDGFNPQAWAVKIAFDTTFNAIFTVIFSAKVGSTFLDKSDNLALAKVFPLFSSSLLSRWQLGF